jgi:hypothetical protein
MNKTAHSRTAGFEINCAKAVSAFGQPATQTPIMS